jgi:hypothetical protein
MIQDTVFCHVRPCSCISGYQLPQTRVRPHFLLLICCGPEKDSSMFFFSMVFQSPFTTQNIVDFKQAALYLHISWPLDWSGIYYLATSQASFLQPPYIT